MARLLGSTRWLGLCGIWALLTVAGCNDAQPGKPAVPSAGSASTPTPPVQPAPSGGVRRFILLTNGNSPFWDAGKVGIDDAKRDLKLAEAGFDASMEYNDGTIAGQITKLRQFNSQTDIAGIGISAIDAKNVNVSEELKSLKKKGVAVVTFDSDLDRETQRDARTAFIGTDNFQGGRELGVCLKQLLPEGGEYVTFVGLLSAQNAKERIDGFAEGAGDKFKSADAMADDFDKTKAKDNVRNAIGNHPNLKAVVGIYSYNAPAIIAVVKEMNKRDALKVVAFDADPVTISQMGQGQVDAMMVQNPYQMGYQSVRLMKALVTDDEATQKEMLPKLGEANGDIYDTGLKVVVPDTNSPIKKDAFGPQTEYLTLEAFKEWLAKYNLTTS